MPKLPPPPRSPQNRSAFSASFAWTRQPSAVTTSAATRLSHARPCRRINQPMPPPRVKPPIPVDDTRPPVVASPYACVSWSTSAQTAPPPTVARRASGSTRTPFMGERSITSPPSQVEKPATLWPPPRTATGRWLLRAKPIAAITSAAPVHLATSAGRRPSCAPFQIRQASAYPSSLEVRISPRTVSRSSWTVASPSTGAMTWVIVLPPFLLAFGEVVSGRVFAQP